MRILRILCPIALLGCAGGSTAPGETGSTTSSPASGTPAGSTTTTSGPSTGTPSTTPVPTGWVQVDPQGGAIPLSVDGAIGEDGTLYVSWATDTGEIGVHVARSVDGGLTWEPAVDVDGSGVEPLISTGRQPYVHADAGDVWVVFTSADPADVHLFRADAGGPLTFGPVPVDTGAVDFVDYAKVATGPDGEAWVTWLSYLGADIWPSLGRESTGFTGAEAGTFPDLPCECCRNDLIFTTAGTPILVFRGNDGQNRDIWSLRGTPGGPGFASSVQVSSTGWESFVCPMQGPRMAQLGDGTLLATWTDPTPGPWSAWLARSTDDGASWSGDTRIDPSLSGAQRSPDIAADGQDVWVTFEHDGGFSLLGSTDGGASWAVLETLDSGATDLEEPQVVARDGVAIVVGANAAGDVVLQRLK